MRRAKSYSIVDHQLLHGGYLRRLSHESMCLYLFLVVVGDREGRSFYGDGTIMDILRLDGSQLSHSREELLRERLISYKSPYWWVMDISVNSSEIPSPTMGAKKRVEERRVDREFGRQRAREIVAALSSKKGAW